MRIMEPYDSFRFYQSIKLHFESDSYDAIKYNYKTSVKPQSFWKRRDKYFFAKVGKKFDDASELVRYYVSYFIQDKNWIGDMLDDDDTYRLYQKRIQSLGYTFEQDLNKLAELGNFDQVLDSSDGHPAVITSYMSGDINIESVVILNQLTGFMNKADKEITETIVWPDVSRKIRKYSPFVSYDLEKAKNIVLRVFTQ
jgi:hypothetical protein